MAARREAPPLGISRGRLATLAVGTLLAVVATGTLVLSDNPRVLRLAVVVALWAFVVGAMAGVRRRPAEPVGTTTDPATGTAVELRRVYEVELERDLAARREFQAQLAADLQRALDEGLRQQVEVVRDDVRLLHDQVMARLEGELRVERVAWQGESTRLTGGSTSMRGLAEGERRHSTGSVHTTGGLPAIAGELQNRSRAAQQPGLPPAAGHPAVSPDPAPVPPPPAHRASPPGYQPPGLPFPPPYQSPATYQNTEPVLPPLREPAPTYRPASRDDRPPARPVPAEPPPRPDPLREARPDPLRDPLPPDLLGQPTPFERTRFGSDTGEFVRPAVPEQPATHRPRSHQAPPAGQHQPYGGAAPYQPPPAYPPPAGRPAAPGPSHQPAPPDRAPGYRAASGDSTRPAWAPAADLPGLPGNLTGTGPAPPQAGGRGGRHAQSEHSEPQQSPRRRRYREDHEENDVLKRMLPPER
jgi:hypothetical protein